MEVHERVSKNLQRIRREKQMSQEDVAHLADIHQTYLSGVEGGKVYLCRAPKNLADPGTILLFYKSSSKLPPSRAVTAIGILEEMNLATSTQELRRLAGGRSVYSEKQLEGFAATAKRPVKVISYLLAGYFDPAISIADLTNDGVFAGPPQSITAIPHFKLEPVLRRIQLGFDV